jgi:hypothetical protein
VVVDPVGVLEVGPDQMSTTVRSGARSDEHTHLSQLIAQANDARTFDSMIWTSCSFCDRNQRLSEATVDQTDDLETVYFCVDGCGPLLIVSARTEPEPPLKKGYRLGLWMIRNPRDIRLRFADRDGVMGIHAVMDPFVE